MVELVNIIILTEILLESSMLGTLIAAYIFLIPVIFVSFLNIYSVDKYEYLNHKQKCIQFKHKIFFVIMYSKNKHIVSKKTLITELIGYILSIASITSLVFSLNQDVDTAFIMLGVVYLVVLTFGCVTGGMYHKIRKYLI